MLDLQALSVQRQKAANDKSDLFDFYHEYAYWEMYAEIQRLQQQLIKEIK